MSLTENSDIEYVKGSAETNLMVAGLASLEERFEVVTIAHKVVVADQSLQGVAHHVDVDGRLLDAEPGEQIHKLT